MTDAELTAIRARRVNDWYDEYEHGDVSAGEDIDTLLVEYDRLTAIVGGVRRCPNCHRECLAGNTYSVPFDPVTEDEEPTE